MAWTDITSTAKVGDYLGYIRFANQVLNIQGAATASSANGLSVFNIQENTKYRVTMEMQSRFRLGCVATLTTGQTVTNYVFHELDDNTNTSQNGATETLEITSDAGQIYLLVGGWSTGGGGAVLDTLATIVVEEETAGQTYTVTYYGQYTKSGITVVNTPPEPITANYGELISAPTAMTKTGYVFSGWYKEAACTNAWDFSTDTVTGDITLYPKWTAQVGYLGARQSNGNHSVWRILQSVELGTLLDEPTSNPTLSGYAFGGWYKELTCTNEWDFASDVVTGNIVLFAKFGCTATYRYNFTGATEPYFLDDNAIVGSALTEPAEPTREGYAFGGWYKESGCINEWVFIDANYTLANVMLFAKWTLTYSVTYNQNYAGAPTATVVSCIESGELITQPTPPTRDGFDFDGWYKESGCINKWDFASDTLTANITLYAKWVPVVVPTTQDPVETGYIVAYPATATTFTTNGLKLLHPTRAVITCEDNADYFLEIETTLESREYLQEGKIIAVDVPWSANRQAFRCCNPQISGRRVSVKAWHVYYDAEQLLLQDSRAEDKTAAQALAWFNAATDATSPFTTSSNISETHTLYMVRKTLDDAIQSVIDYWGGHLVRDNFSIAINASIGQDRGLRVEYGNNMTSWRIDENWDNVCTRLLPVGKDGQLLDAIYADATGVSYDTRYAKVVSFNQDIDQADYTTAEGEPDTAAYTAALKADLVTQATAYLNAHKLPEINYQIGTYLPPAGAIIDVGDTVRIAGHPQCNMDLTTQVISYQYDCLMQQYVKIEIGNFKRKKLSRLLDETVKKTTTVIADVKTDTDNKINDAKTELEAAIESVSYTQYDSFIIPADGWVDDAENTFEHYPFKNVILVEGVESGMSAGNWMLNNDDYYEQGAKVAPGASVGSGTVTFYATQSLTVDITVEIMQIGR